MSQPEERAPLGHPAEAEVPHHSPDPGAPAERGQAVEDSTAYELAVEDGTALPPPGAPSDADAHGTAQSDGTAEADGGPLFLEPGAG